MKISKEMINPMIERLRSEIGYYIPISREYVVTEALDNIIIGIANNVQLILQYVLVN